MGTHAELEGADAADLEPAPRVWLVTDIGGLRQGDGLQEDEVVAERLAGLRDGRDLTGPAGLDQTVDVLGGWRSRNRMAVLVARADSWDRGDDGQRVNQAVGEAHQSMPDSPNSGMDGEPTIRISGSGFRRDRISLRMSSWLPSAAEAR